MWTVIIIYITFSDLSISKFTFSESNKNVENLLTFFTKSDTMITRGDFMIGDKIKKLRNKKKIYQQELADALSVSKSTVAMWETNRREPDIETIKKIAAFFNCSISYLLSDKIKFDFSPHDIEESIKKCPICNHDLK